MSDCISLILSILKPPCLVKSTDDTFDSVFHFNLLSFSFPVLLSPSIFLPPNSISLPFLVCCVLSYILNCFLQFICLFLSSLNSLTIFTSKFLNSPSGILLISVSLDFVIGELWLLEQSWCLVFSCFLYFCVAIYTSAVWVPLQFYLKILVNSPHLRAQVPVPLREEKTNHFWVDFRSACCQATWCLLLSKALPFSCFSMAVFRCPVLLFAVCVLSAPLSLG